MGDDAVTVSQDSLRPVRQFVSLLGDAFALADNTYASQDRYVINTPRGYQVIGPYGVSVEGTTSQILSTTNAGGIVISPMLVLVALGFAAAMFWKR